MKPPYEITGLILQLVAAISGKLGEVKANYLHRPSPLLRKQHKIRTIHSSLKVEGNTLTEEQITALLENKRVIGPQKAIRKVINAIKEYENTGSYRPGSS